jgi:hypothetical protein
MKFNIFDVLNLQNKDQSSENYEEIDSNLKKE